MLIEAASFVKNARFIASSTRRSGFSRNGYHWMSRVGIGKKMVEQEDYGPLSRSSAGLNLLRINPLQAPIPMGLMGSTFNCEHSEGRSH